MNRRVPAQVLLLDSRNDARRAYCDALRSAGIEVTVVTDVETAAEIIKETVPQIVVVGFDSVTREKCVQFCRTVKADPQTAGVPVLLLEAADASDEDLGLATDPGVLVLKVPRLDGGKLVGAIEGVLAGQRAQPARASLPRHRRGDRGRSA